MALLILALVIVAGILAAVDLIRSQGQSLLAWAVLALAVALALPQLA